MLRVSAPGLAQSIESARPNGRHTDQMVGSILSDISRLLWPDKTAAHVAAACGCTERAAERYLAGDREWSANAIAAIVSEICRRHAMRNIRITAKG